jgi:arylsulfatase A-like enzyme
MDIVYDLKMLDEAGELQTKYRKFYERNYNRMNAEQKAKWDAYYDPIIADFKAKGLKGKELALWKYQRYMQDYLKCVKSVDKNVGYILDYLDNNDLAKNTIVVYTSDQGFYMGEHGWFDKRFMYEESLRTPLVMRFPNGFKPKGNIQEMVQNIDYAPTLLDYAGVEIPKEVQGKSLRPLLENKNKDWRDAIYYHYLEFPNEHGTKKHYGIRTERYKLIHFYEDIDVWELYDLKNDPTEMNNIYDEKANEALIVDLKKRLRILKKQYKDE